MAGDLSKRLEKIVEHRGLTGKLVFKYHEEKDDMIYVIFSKIDNSLDINDKQQMLLEFDLYEHV